MAFTGTTYDPLNIRDYGAYGNDLTDDTAAFQSAIDDLDAQGGGTLFVPSGRYIIDPVEGLHVKSNIHITGIGYNSMLKAPYRTNASGNMIKIEQEGNVTISNLRLFGDRLNQQSGTNYGLYVSGSENCFIYNVMTDGWTGVGNHVYNCDGVTVQGCISTDNVFHGFECEQARGCSWVGNRGFENERHGIFISPGEVDGTGAKGNMIIGNSFDHNTQYGVAVGAAAAPGSELLTFGTIISGNSVRYNHDYGISLYTMDGSNVTNNTIEYNGMFGIQVYKSQLNRISGNILHNNSQLSNNGYDEIIFEGNADGRASINNIVTENIILIDGGVKARWAINEATAGDGTNTIANNTIPFNGVSGGINNQ